MKKQLGLAVVALSVLWSASRVASAETGGPPAEVKRLERFLGKWKGTGKVTIEGKSTDVTMTLDCTRVAGGWGVQCRFLAKGVPGMPTYDGMSILGWDAGTSTVHWYWITNAGETHDHHGTWTGADTLDVPHTGMANGKPLKETFTLTFKSPKEIAFTAVTTRGGQVGESFEGTFKK
jgi:hypothetical protein